MKCKELYITMRDNKKIYTKISSPDNIERTLGVVCIVHGSCEHSKRIVYKAYNQYKDCGLNNVEIKMYDGMRHEILNEINKDEVYKDILYWVNK